MDRWLICSQWAGIWAASSAANLSKYAAGLANCAQDLVGKPGVASMIDALAALMETNLKEIEQAAVNFLSTLNADNRQQVRTYYTALWLWNRLDKTRWNSAQLILRQKPERRNSIEVDHIVSWDLWKTKLAEISVAASAVDGEPQGTLAEEFEPRVNEIGNCMLLEKNFNISKSNATLKNFLDDVYEFKDKKLVLSDWAATLDLDMAQVDCSATPVDRLQELTSARSQKIRGDLEKFIRGAINRIDVG
jgi:hypothetical protein